MKIVITTCILALFFAFKSSTDKGAATVEQKEGIYIFLFSKPTSSYDYLGSVKKSIAWSGKPEEMLNSMLKKVKKEYPQANGMIFTNMDMDKADAVKFKE